MTRHLPLLAVLVLAAAGCAPAPSNDSTGADTAAVDTAPATATLSGTVTYRQKIALPTDATVMVTLQDVSRADSAAITVGVDSFHTAGRQVPLPYSITYDPAAIDPAMTYGVRARILLAGEVEWTSDTFTPVLTQGGASDSVEVVVVPASR